ncbi:MAG: SPOR domain-containing protein [Candidatus Marinimicrobia bacterium]|nr:SPOR domain-containing protein [Candidatus Neomarinimicrobiota bacterium]MBL7009805.1 SPOR domain-containing protein [Candidatus Neomarinimicrobiota bacterium]MBL7029791.1 SPOR domain-containing protein [Candidatus Neomarinimicrobiota bacterium]
MRYIILIGALSMGLAQEKKIDFDPDKLNDPEPRWPKVISPLTPAMDRLKPEEKADSIQVIIEGFRVQVLATRTRENADQLRNALGEIYSEDIYIVFEAPNYKVRLGNYIDRRHAETMRQTLVKSGYPTAWIIRTRIEPKLK